MHGHVLNHYQKVVLDYLRACGAKGSTDEEGITGTGLNRNTYPPRRTELSQLGVVVDSGLRRETESGKDAIVWVSAVSENGTARPQWDRYRCACGWEGTEPQVLHTAGGMFCHKCGAVVEKA
jgi:hypothetical protein